MLYEHTVLMVVAERLRRRPACDTVAHAPLRVYSRQLDYLPMKPATVKDHFDTYETVVLTGFSKSMLDYLVRDRIFAPSLSTGPGVGRRYTYADVVILRALKAVCAGTRRIKNLRKSMKTFRREFGALSPGMRLTDTLLVQGNQLCVSTAVGTMELDTGQYTLPLVIDLPGISQQIAESIRVDPKQPNLFCLEPKLAKKAEEERLKYWLPIKDRRDREKKALRHG
jgi:hypothetical protein